MKTLDDAIRSEIDHAVINDLRLAPAFGQQEGDPAVRVSALEAVLGASSAGLYTTRTMSREATPSAGIVAELLETAPKLERALRVEPPLTLDESNLMRRAAALIERLDAAADEATETYNRVSSDRANWRRIAESLEEEKSAKEARITALEAEIARLRGALDGIYTYCNDTLSGRVDGGQDDRAWQREAVIRARNLARPFARPEIEATVRAQALSRSTEKNDGAV